MNLDSFFNIEDSDDNGLGSLSTIAIKVVGKLIYFKSFHNLLHLDFSGPTDQNIVFNECKETKIYLFSEKWIKAGYGY